jgi:carbon storage regulator
MLVLSRRKDESIVINDEIEIKVVEISGKKIKLGITAPKNIDIHRREIYEIIKNNKENNECTSKV